MPAVSPVSLIKRSLEVENAPSVATYSGAGNRLPQRVPAVNINASGRSVLSAGF